MRSIRARLLAGLLALVAVTMICAGIITYRQLLAESSALLDYQLRQMALSLRDEAGIAPGLLLPLHPTGSDVIIEIWHSDGTLQYFSRAPLDTSRTPLITRAILGYADMVLEGQRWRVYSLDTMDGVIQVAQPWSVRERLARASALRVLVPMLLLLLVMAAAVAWVVARGLAPLRRLAGEVQRRDARSLEPIAAPELPAEAAPLIEELNRLLGRLAAAFGKQRAFVADAAHELRSPLTALSLQLQLLDRARDEAARSEARARLGAAIERAIHLSTQLLTLARNEPDGGAARFQRVRLAEAARAGIADVHALAEQLGIELTLSADEAAYVEGDADALRVLVRNLVDNALRYSPRGARVAVAVEQAGSAARLVVEDRGPGIPPAERERVFDRFFRRPDAAEGGSGLGLAIVKAIAGRHGARIELLDASPQGLRVVVEFPPSAPPSESVP